MGTNAIILPGVSIGAKSVIHTGSVVTRDVLPNSVAVGIPTRVIKQFSLDQEVAIHEHMKYFDRAEHIRGCILNAEGLRGESG